MNILIPMWKGVYSNSTSRVTVRETAAGSRGRFMLGSRKPEIEESPLPASMSPLLEARKSLLGH